MAPRTAERAIPGRGKYAADCAVSQFEIQPGPGRSREHDREVRKPGCQHGFLGVRGIVARTLALWHRFSFPTSEGVEARLGYRYFATEDGDFDGT